MNEKERLEGIVNGLEKDLEKAKKALKELDEVKPWVPSNQMAFRRSFKICGEYGVVDLGSLMAVSPGYSHTEEQARARALLDKQNDILWGLKMTLEPDWVPDWNDNGTGKFHVRYGHGSRCWNWDRFNVINTVGTVHFSVDNIERVIKYLDNNHSDGIKL